MLQKLPACRARVSASQKSCEKTLSLRMFFLGADVLTEVLAFSRWFALRALHQSTRQGRLCAVRGATKDVSNDPLQGRAGQRSSVACSSFMLKFGLCSGNMDGCDVGLAPSGQGQGSPFWNFEAFAPAQALFGMLPDLCCFIPLIWPQDARLDLPATNLRKPLERAGGQAVCRCVSMERCIHMEMGLITLGEPCWVCMSWVP